MKIPQATRNLIRKMVDARLSKEELAIVRDKEKAMLSKRLDSLPLRDNEIDKRG